VAQGVERAEVLIDQVAVAGVLDVGWVGDGLISGLRMTSHRPSFSRDWVAAMRGVRNRGKQRKSGQTGVCPRMATIDRPNSDAFGFSHPVVETTRWTLVLKHFPDNGENSAWRVG